MRPLRQLLTTDPERGSASAWAVVTTIAMLLFVGIALDFAGQLEAQQSARAVAAQAARAGGQQVVAPQAIRGQGVTAQPGDAHAAAANFLAGAGVEGSVQVTGDRVIVDTSNPYSTKFLSIVGITTLPATGHAEARITRAVGGVEQ